MDKKDILNYAVIWLVSIISVFGQTEHIDSMRQSIYSMQEDTTKAHQLGYLAYVTANYDKDASMQHAIEGIALSQKLDYVSGEIYSLMSLAFSEQNLGLNDGGLPHVQRAKFLYDNQATDRRYGNYIYTFLAHRESNLGNKTKAIAYHHQAQKINEELKDTAELINALSSLGGIYAESGELSQGILMFRDAISLSEQSGDNWRLASNLIRLIECVEDTIERKSLIYRAKAIIEDEGNSYLTAYYKYAVGNYYLQVENDFKKAINNYKESYLISVIINDGYFSSYVPRLLAEAYEGTGQLDSAEYYGRIAVTKAYEVNDINLKKSSTIQIGSILYRRKKYKQAYDSLMVAFEIRDTLFRQENASSLADAEVKYLTEKKDASLALQELEILKIENQRNKLVSGGVFFLLLLGGLVLWNYERQKRKNKEAELALFEKQKEAESLKELDDMKNQFFTNVSHELRTPLTLILGPLSDVMELTTDNTIKKAIHLAYNNADRLLSMVNEVLDLSKLESGHIPLHISQVGLDTFLRRSVMAFESMAEIRDINIYYESNLDNDYIRTDIEKLEKIINNLISNAIKYSNNGSKIIVKSTLAKDQLSITVQDFGKGILLEEREKIFNRFYQSNVVTAVEGGGTGVGLALSKELAQLLGGSLTVQSELGQGSTFRLQIKVEPSSNMIDSTTDTPERSTIINYNPILINGEKPHVLIIEDNADMSSYLHTILKEDYRCSFANDGFAALKLIQTQHFDLISSDIMMPHMDGLSLKDKVNQLEGMDKIPFVFLTAKAMYSNKIQGLKLGVDDYITKPFNKHEYKARIYNLMTNKKNREQYKSSNPAEGISDKNVEEALLRKAEVSILANLSNNKYKISDLASELNYSQRQLGRVIKKLTGMTPVNLILELRLQRAYKLIKTKSKNTVIEVMYEVGIESASYFARKFKERFGINPGEL